MAYQIDFLPDVFDDIQAAVSWYNSKQKGLGKKFFMELNSHYKILKRDPFCVAVRYDDIRCMPVSRFSYCIHYRVEHNTQTIVIFAIYHSSRNPNILKDRLYEDVACYNK